jgi:putative phosphoribosyl transferase
MKAATQQREVIIAVGDTRLSATLAVPDEARGLVLFAHGSGSSRHSPRNRYVARVLQSSGFGTLLLDLLTPEEEQIDARTNHLRFDIEFLANRLIAATRWVGEQPVLRGLPIGYFGASTGAAAALVAASRLPDAVRAVVARGGRPDLAGDCLPDVRCPTLMVVGGCDEHVLALNRVAFDALATRDKDVHVIAGAGHLFEEPGTLEQAAATACEWFVRHLEATGAS